MRLIDADALTKRHCEGCPEAVKESCKNDPVCATLIWVGEEPTIDPKSLRPKGEWIGHDCYCCNSDGEPVIKTGTVFVCSVCGREERCEEPYCHCGADMRGDSK